MTGRACRVEALTETVDLSLELRLVLEAPVQLDVEVVDGGGQRGALVLQGGDSAAQVLALSSKCLEQS